MITEDYVSFETAKLLKEKGFDEPCVKKVTRGVIPDILVIEASEKSSYPQPTLQMAMKWLRKAHHYYIQVMLDGWACGGHMGYYVVIQKTDSDFEMMLQDVRERVFYDTPEEAAEDTIKYIVENLI